MTALWLLALVVVASALVSTMACGAYLGMARRRQWLAHPNHRSSHALPTPHGGGVGIVLALAIAVALAGWVGEVDWGVPLWLLLALAVALMVLGVVDDFFGVSVRLRMGAYALCCIVAATLLMMPLSPLGWWLVLPAAFALLWLLNLYNFMDGIDGIAAIQCILACGAAGLLALVYGEARVYALFCCLLACCHLGFLAWNLPPARLFMGDAGSIPTGFLIGGLILLGEVSGAVSAAAWIILLACFLTDATWTLMVRILRRENFFQAHRGHLYQRLSRRWQSHLLVDLALIAVVCLWLFPLAWLAQTNQQYSLFLVILAYSPLLICMAKMQRLT